MTAIALDPAPIAAFCQRNHVQRLSLFGSALRGELCDGSDVDFLVEFEPGHVPGFFGLVRMEEELSEIVGRKADLRTPAELRRHFRDDVLAAAREVYSRG